MKSEARVTLNLSGKMDDPEVEVGSLIAVEELDNMEDLDVGEKPEETLEDNLEEPSDENEVDQTAREAWGQIFNGNASDIQKVVDEFMAKYSDHIHDDEEYEIEDVKWQDLKKACGINTQAVGCMDKWTKAEFRLLFDRAFMWLAKWFN